MDHSDGVLAIVIAAGYSYGQIWRIVNATGVCFMLLWWNMYKRRQQQQLQQQQQQRQYRVTNDRVGGSRVFQFSRDPLIVVPKRYVLDIRSFCGYDTETLR